MIILLRFFIPFLCLKLQAQNVFQVYDSVNQRPLAGVTMTVNNQSAVYYSDIDGKIYLTQTLPKEDTIIFSYLGYERRIYSTRQLPKKIYLSPRRYLLPDIHIKPIIPKEYIEQAFKNFYTNHLPRPFSQNVFYREEFIVNDRYLRFQEIEMEVYQFPKTTDKRKFFISGSYPKIHRFYRQDDSLLMNEIKLGLGKIAGKHLKFDYLSGYSNVKGVNILNYVFTFLLDSKYIEYKYQGTENIKGHLAIHIKGFYIKEKVVINEMDIYLEESSYAVLHLAIQAKDENLTKQFLDFKTRFVLWVLGIKINVQKYYSKIQFTQTKEGIWVVEDFALMFPISIQKKRKFDMYLNIGYRMHPKIITKPKTLDYSVYSENQLLLESPNKNKRFSETLDFSIPTMPAQLDRLRKMKVK